MGGLATKRKSEGVRLTTVESLREMVADMPLPVARGYSRRVMPAGTSKDWEPAPDWSVTWEAAVAKIRA